MNYGYIPNWTKALSQNVIYNFPISTLSSHSRALNSDEMFWSLDMRIVSCFSKFMQMTCAQFHNNLIRNVKEVCSKKFVTLYGDQPMADRANLTNPISNMVCKGKCFFTPVFLFNSDHLCMIFQQFYALLRSVSQMQNSCD